MCKQRGIKGKEINGIIDKDGFIRMYDTYYGKVYNYVFYRVMNRVDCEDIVSDTFIKAFENRERYNTEKAALSTWLFTIAGNCVTDWFRRNKSRPLSIDDIGELECPLSVEETVINEIDAKRLIKCLKELDERGRAVIYLRYKMEFSYNEIAETLGITMGNVGVILARNVKRLRELL